MNDADLTKLIAALPYYLSRGDCVRVLRAAGGMGEDKIKEAMGLLPKEYPLGCRRAKYVRRVFLEAFKLPRPGGS